MNCPECGESVEQNAQFCPKCFARIEWPGFWRKVLSLFQSSLKPSRPIVKINKTIIIKTTDKDGQKHEYHSLAEVPPDMRAQIQKLESEAFKQPIVSSTSDGFEIRSEKSVSVFRVKDASGNERVYRSLDELPPEIRAAIEQAGNKLKA